MLMLSRYGRSRYVSAHISRDRQTDSTYRVVLEQHGVVLVSVIVSAWPFD